MEIVQHRSIEAIPAATWDALVPGADPFLQHAFLAALEHHGCVGRHFGWQPCHLGLWQEDELLAALPLYWKTNSYGELVFDQVWEQAYRRLGLAYFPKLVTAVPYTPATGRRLLCQAGRERELWPRLWAAAQTLARDSGTSGWHCLFPSLEEIQTLAAAGFAIREDCQYHWHNHDYADFADFLQALTSRRRKQIRRERRRVAEAGVRLRRLTGRQASVEDWRHFSRFYNGLFDRKWGMATLNLDFFLAIARQLPDQVLLVLADQGERCIAGALFLQSDTTLYGRHWGCDVQVPDLHFEVCYYQGIEHAIAQRLHSFEPGAQGEHKIARGFLPVRTCSAHWLAQPSLHEAFIDFAARERRALDDWIETLRDAGPYRQEGSPE